jgi:hypothetical protein
MYNKSNQLISKSPWPVMTSIGVYIIMNNIITLWTVKEV